MKPLDSYCAFRILLVIQEFVKSEIDLNPELVFWFPVPFSPFIHMYVHVCARTHTHIMLFSVFQKMTSARESHCPMQSFLSFSVGPLLLPLKCVHCRFALSAKERNHEEWWVRLSGARGLPRSGEQTCWVSWQPWPGCPLGAQSPSCLQTLNIYAVYNQRSVFW